MKKKVLHSDIFTDLISVNFDIAELSKKISLELHIAHAEMSAKVYKQVTGRELTNNDKDITITFEPLWTININGVNVGYLQVSAKGIEPIKDYYIEFIPKK